MQMMPRISCPQRVPSEAYACPSTDSDAAVISYPRWSCPSYPALRNPNNRGSVPASGYNPHECKLLQPETHPIGPWSRSYSAMTWTQCRTKEDGAAQPSTREGNARRFQKTACQLLIPASCIRFCTAGL